MISRGCCIFTLLTSYVLSIPVPSDQVEKDDIKVMKCIVEVIADTLSKPHPVTISPECQDSLTGDERIVSILRHQNLLKELQEIAAQGVSERVHQPPQKKNEKESDQVTDPLEGHADMEDTTCEQREQSPTRERPAQRGDTTQEDPTTEGDNEVEEEIREKSAESRECNEIGGTSEGEVGETEGGDEKDKDEENHRNHISDSANRGEEEEEEEEEQRNTAPVEEEETQSSSGEDEGKGKEQNETEEDDSAQFNKDGETDRPTAVPEAESDEKRSKQLEEEEEETEGGPEMKRRSEEVEKEGEEESMEEVKKNGESRPAFERWSKRGQESPHEPSEGAEETGHVGTEGREPMEGKQQSPQLLWYTPHRSKESSLEARGDTDEKREEEGSASHRGEDHEIERLAVIESELESVAQRLHELRRS